MKNLLLVSLALLACCFLLVAASPGYALTPTPTDAPVTTSSTPSQKVTEKLSEQINNLKDRIASRVAQLNLVEKRGIIGTVKDAGGTKITITDLMGNDRFADVDEITKFSSGSNKNTSFGISDLTSGVIISILGNYNKESKRILARYIDVVTLPVIVNGVISNIDKTSFTITATTEDNKKMLVDIENTTKTSEYTDADDIVKAGFSKITVGERVHVVGYADKKEKNRMTATRILLFPELKPNPKIDISSLPTAVEPTTKLSPTTRSLKATPTP